MDVCGFHSICSVYEAFGLALLVAFRVFVVFMGHCGWTFVAFEVFVLFMECLGWTFVACTAFAAFMSRSGWSFLWRLKCS